MNEPDFSEGLATLTPEGPVAAGSQGVWAITYVVGESGLSPGDALRLTIPTGFSAPQTDNSNTPGFVKVETGNLASLFRVALEPLPGQIDKDLREEAGAQAVYLFLERGPMRPGETVEFEGGLKAKIVDDLGAGKKLIEFEQVDVQARLEQVGRE